jgi:hypothetical protein
LSRDSLFSGTAADLSLSQFDLSVGELAYMCWAQKRHNRSSRKQVAQQDEHD